MWIKLPDLKVFLTHLAVMRVHGILLLEWASWWAYWVSFIFTQAALCWTVVFSLSNNRILKLLVSLTKVNEAGPSSNEITQTGVEAVGYSTTSSGFRCTAWAISGLLASTGIQIVCPSEKVSEKPTKRGVGENRREETKEEFSFISCQN